MSIKLIIRILLKSGIGILPTDTIYGLVGLALSQKAVEKIYKVRQRNPKKPFIILISSIRDLSRFGIQLNVKMKKILENFWPGKVSVILPCQSQKFFYLHRGTKTLAFRLPLNAAQGKPAKFNLIKLLKKTGPLVAPSANPEGLPPAKTIQQAKNYFGNKADFYLDAGELKSGPSTLIEIKSSRIIIKRNGVVKISGVWLKK